MDRFLRQLQRQWVTLGFAQKLVAGTVLVAVVLSSVFFVQRSQEDFDVLYSGMSVADAAATVAKLKDLKTPYRLADGGTTVLVPRALKSDMTLETAGDLTSEQTVNLAKIPPVVQGDVEKEWIKQANTDAISKVLTSIRGIRHAQVIVSQPESSLFSENDQSTTASVMLVVDPGFHLRSDQVKTVKNLVSHGVPGLKQENVTIADNAGNLLDDNATNTVGGLQEADKKRHLFEEETNKKILGVLGPIVGKDNVVVSVSAKLNFDQAQSKIHRLIPAGGTEETPTGLAISKQEQIEEYAGGKKSEGGMAGVDSNATTPSYQEAQSKNKGDNNYKSQKSTVNYAHSEEDKQIVYAQGEVERMTIAVVLNKVLTATETDEIKEFVANAAGVDYARGDSVDIKGFQFSESPLAQVKSATESSKAMQGQGFVLQLASVASVAVLGLASLIVFYLLFKKPAEGEVFEEDNGPQPQQNVSYMLEGGGYPEPPPGFDMASLIAAGIDQATAANLLANATASGALGGGSTPAERQAMPEYDPYMENEIEQIRDTISQMVENDPAQVARILTTYVKEV